MESPRLVYVLDSVSAAAVEVVVSALFRFGRRTNLAKRHAIGKQLKFRFSRLFVKEFRRRQERKFFFKGV